MNKEAINQQKMVEIWGFCVSVAMNSFVLPGQAPCCQCDFRFHSLPGSRHSLLQFLYFFPFLDKPNNARMINPIASLLPKEKVF